MTDGTDRLQGPYSGRRFYPSVAGRHPLIRSRQDAEASDCVLSLRPWQAEGHSTCCSSYKTENTHPFGRRRNIRPLASSDPTTKKTSRHAVCLRRRARASGLGSPGPSPGPVPRLRLRPHLGRLHARPATGRPGPGYLNHPKQLGCYRGHPLSS